ncbi:MAG: polyprenyl synthetase family protein [Actinomycetota bacterium]|nr:polyprenyl synthetase family protein [Actinomycetota bacterium]
MSLSYPEDLKLLVNEALRQYFPRSDRHLSVVSEAMSYSLFSPGKRFRPVLTLLAAEALGADPKIALPVACAIEFIHTYSLIHDDLPAIDNDDLRRGRATCHIKFGEDVAILAGDALFAEAFVLVLTEQQKYADAGRLLETLRELAAATGINGMVGGQAVDIMATGADVDRDTLEYIHNHKTGSLITAAARCGAILGGGSAAEIEAISEYAKHLGLTFQIIDDILDVVGSTDGVGKHVGRDADNRKTTFPGQLGVDKAQDEAQATAAMAIEALSGAGFKTDRLVDMANFVLRRTS